MFFSFYWIILLSAFPLKAFENRKQLYDGSPHSTSYVVKLWDCTQSNGGHTCLQDDSSPSTDSPPSGSSSSSGASLGSFWLLNWLLA